MFEPKIETFIENGQHVAIIKVGWVRFMGSSNSYVGALENVAANDEVKRRALNRLCRHQLSA